MTIKINDDVRNRVFSHIYDYEPTQFEERSVVSYADPDSDQYVRKLVSVNRVLVDLQNANKIRYVQRAGWVVNLPFGKREDRLQFILDNCKHKRGTFINVPPFTKEAKAKAERWAI